MNSTLARINLLPRWRLSGSRTSPENQQLTNYEAKVPLCRRSFGMRRHLPTEESGIVASSNMAMRTRPAQIEGRHVRLVAILAASYMAVSLGVAATPSPEIPSDIPSAASAPDAESFAWQMFVALNWPAKLGQRGVADTNERIGDSGLAVWESFKNSDEIFLPGATDPGPWNSAFSVNRRLRLTQTAKAPQGVLRLSGVNQAVGGPVTDQNGNVVYYEKAANQVSYEFIRSNHLYDPAAQSAFGPVRFPFGALEIKAAWRILTAADNPARYHKTAAMVLQRDGSMASATVGLVGLHITVKTKNAPQWIWCTFEQVDNVPPAVDGVRSSFNNPSSNQPANVETPPGTPTQIARTLMQLSPSVRTLNKEWQAALRGTAWQYYQLIDAQFPTNPQDPATFDGDPQPTLLANTVLETYIQRTSSCVDCHSTARSLGGQISDFSFLLLNAHASAAIPHHP